MNYDYLKGLEEIMEPALESASLDLIHKFFRDYLRVYREGIIICRSTYGCNIRFKDAVAMPEF